LELERTRCRGDGLLRRPLQGSQELPRDLPDSCLVVRELPAETERNQFRITLTAKDERTGLFRDEFVWESNYGVEGLSFKVPLAPLLETAPSAFVAKLYSVATRSRSCGASSRWKSGRKRNRRESRVPKKVACAAGPSPGGRADAD